jgi:hypothetical protein
MLVAASDSVIAESMTPSPGVPVDNNAAVSTRELEPEKKLVLEQAAFDALLEVLQVQNPQLSIFTSFTKLASKLYTPGIQSRMLAGLGGATWREAHRSTKFWVELHSKLEEFRNTTGYSGKAGEEWQAHKQTLMALSWKESFMPALTAHRQLGLWVEESKKRGEWVASDAEKFAGRLATFSAALLQAPNVSAEDLAGGFKGYNVELFAWFQV